MIKFGVYKEGGEASAALSRMDNRVDLAIAASPGGGVFVIVQVGKQFTLPGNIQAYLQPELDVITYYDIYQVPGINANQLSSLLVDNNYQLIEDDR